MISRVQSNDRKREELIEAICFVNTLAQQPTAEDCWSAVLDTFEDVSQRLCVETAKAMAIQEKDERVAAIEKKFEELGTFSVLFVAIMSMANRATDEQKARIQQKLNVLPTHKLAAQIQSLLLILQTAAIKLGNPGLQLQAQVLAPLVTRLQKGSLEIVYNPILNPVS